FAAANNYHLIKKGKKVSSIRSGLSLAKLKNALAKEQKKNEHSPYRIIGLTLETRPDFITAQELEQMRLLGCTRVELGAQTVDDQILELTRRGHSSQTVAAATALLKDFGFKVTYHLMPGLPGSTLAKDKQTFKKIFSCADFQPDQIKFYPTVVVKGSRLYQWWRQGKYQPYSTNQLKRLIAECKAMVPPFVRIVRLIRDIPSESIEAGNLVTNLRQILQQEKVNCRCIRCREIREQQSRAVHKLKILSYSASGGQEFFLSFEDYQNRLYAFCRLRLPSDKLPVPSPLKNAALVRELHVYGELVPVGGKAKVQHRGLGTKLMQKAEETAKKFGFKKIAVIAGVGARPYYRRLGYRLQYTYMVKRI
ncbi:tRNA uridine(34) 5-carboxymethylaminomethyl modification radical SAM/GNAT enzyme Elp3, partial [Candidatus Parcubacteria bacterium]